MGLGARKTVKFRPSNESNEENYDVYATQENPALDLGKNTIMPSISETQSKNEESNVKINTILNKITGFSSSETKLADFNPPPNPFSNSRKPVEGPPPADEAISAPKNPLMPVSGGQSFSGPKPGDFYKPVSSGGGSYSNYAQAHNSPYYAKMGIGASSQGSDKFMEKINYMVHMLEEQQMEKTNNVTEEFILYSLLGVFMIYLVDGFAQTGKYVR